MQRALRWATTLCAALSIPASAAHASPPPPEYFEPLYRSDVAFGLGIGVAFLSLGVLAMLQAVRLVGRLRAGRSPTRTQRAVGFILTPALLIIACVQSVAYRSSWASATQFMALVVLVIFVHAAIEGHRRALLRALSIRRLAMGLLAGAGLWLSAFVHVQTSDGMAPGQTPIDCLHTIPRAAYDAGFLASGVTYASRSQVHEVDGEARRVVTVESPTHAGVFIMQDDEVTASRARHARHVSIQVVGGAYFALWLGDEAARIEILDDDLHLTRARPVEVDVWQSALTVCNDDTVCISSLDRILRLDAQLRPWGSPLDHWAHWTAQIVLLPAGAFAGAMLFVLLVSLFSVLGVWLLARRSRYEGVVHESADVFVLQVGLEIYHLDLAPRSQPPLDGGQYVVFASRVDINDGPFRAGTILRVHHVAPGTWSDHLRAQAETCHVFWALVTPLLVGLSVSALELLLL